MNIINMKDTDINVLIHTLNTEHTAVGQYDNGSLLVLNSLATKQI
jgi:hypothetical protein